MISKTMLSRVLMVVLAMHAEIIGYRSLHHASNHTAVLKFLNMQAPNIPM
jgi:hypothetical protein